MNFQRLRFMGIGTRMSYPTALSPLIGLGCAMLLGCAVLLGCSSPESRQTESRQTESKQASSEPAQAQAATIKAHYSPFEVVVRGELPYDVISFKDVGLSLESSERRFAYESIAESLSLQLPAALGAGTAAQSHFAPQSADPSNHLSCEARHVYVDMWRPGGQGWGYSLWSGCGENDNFAWRELPRADASQVEPMTRAIAESLANATRTSCFVRHC